MVAESRQIVADMRRRVRLRVAENRIDNKPTQVCSVLVIARLIDILRLIENRRSGSKEPITRIVHVDIRRRVLEIIDIRRTHASHVVRVTRNQMCKLCVDLEGGRRRRGDPGDLVNRVGQPLHLRLPTAVDTPDSVC